MGNACTGLVAPSDDFVGADLYRMGTTVSVVRVYASALVWINFLLLTALLLVSLVPGAALGGSPVDFSALPHLVWFIPNFLMLAFAIHAVANTSYLDVDGFKTMTFSAIIFAVVSAVINVIHVASLAVECGQQTSTFYLQGFPYLVVTLTAFVVFVLWQLWIAARLYVYRNTVSAAISNGWSIMAEVQQAAATKNGYMQIPAPATATSSSAISSQMQYGQQQQYGHQQQYGQQTSPIGANIPLLFQSPKYGQKHE